MATMKDISSRTGLGLATISKYLNGGHVLDKNRIAIDAAIQEMGFRVNEVARSLKTMRTRTIGVVIPELGNVFISSIITVMEDILRKKGYGVIICDCRTDRNQEAEAVKFLISKMVDGIINVPAFGTGHHLVPALEQNLPVVLIDRMLDELEGRVSAVLVDNVEASRQAVELLLGAGHRKIGLILGPREIFTSQQRLKGYHKAFEEAGIPVDDTLLIYSDYTVQGGYESIKRLLAATPTALYITNYEMTLGGMLAINELGIQIPSQLSLIGFDNLQLAQIIRPRLTIVTQPAEQIGEAAAEILLDRLALPAKDLPVKTVTLTTGIVHGESVQDFTAVSGKEQP